jgi:hypothetical protein
MHCKLEGVDAVLTLISRAFSILKSSVWAESSRGFQLSASFRACSTQ